MEGSESDSEQASTCQGSDRETDPRLKPKRTKVSGKAGATVYRTKFKRAWSNTYPFIVGVKADLFKFLCRICQRQLACENGCGKALWQKYASRECKIHERHIVMSQPKRSTFNDIHSILVAHVVYTRPQNVVTKSSGFA